MIWAGTSRRDGNNATAITDAMFPSHRYADADAGADWGGAQREMEGRA
jgi:hypothetical protein